MRVTGNLAATAGGAIYNDGSSPTITNATMSGNSATGDGGALFNTAGSTSQLRNTIIWGNAAAGGPSAVVNDETSSAAISYSVVEGGYAGAGNHSSDPQLTNPALPSQASMTGGDYRLRVNSPAVDAGDNSVVSASTDLWGKPRRFDLTGVPDTGSGDAPVVDIGAHELLAVNISSITRLSPASAATAANNVQLQVGPQAASIHPATQQDVEGVLRRHLDRLAAKGEFGDHWVKVREGAGDGVTARRSRALVVREERLSYPAWMPRQPRS